MSADEESRAAVESAARAIAERHQDAVDGSAAQAWADYAAAGLVATGDLSDAGDDWFEYACAVIRGAHRGQPSVPLITTALARLIFGPRLPEGVTGAAIALVDPGLPRSFEYGTGPGGAPTVDGSATGVPWADPVTFVVVPGPGAGSWLLLPAALSAPRPRDDPWRRTVADIRLSRVTALAESSVPVEVVLAHARIAAAAAMAGTMTAMVERTVRYAREREQFGRPLWAFQAIKHQIVVAAELAKVAERASLVTADISRTPDLVLTALLAKAAAGSAATTVAQVSHHVHGAIGMTDEFALSHLTRQLFGLRDRFGSEHECLRALGMGLAAADRAGTGLWELITTL